MFNRRFSLKNTFFYAATVSQVYGLFARNLNDDIPFYDSLSLAYLSNQLGLPDCLEDSDDKEQLLGIFFAIILDSVLLNFLKKSDTSLGSAIKLACGTVSISCILLGKLAEKMGFHEENPLLRAAI